MIETQALFVRTDPKGVFEQNDRDFRNFENMLRAARTTEAGIFSANAKLVWEGEALDDGKMPLPNEVARGIMNTAAVITMSHGNGSPPTPKDVRTWMNLATAELRLVTPEYTYVLTNKNYKNRPDVMVNFEAERRMERALRDPAEVEKTVEQWSKANPGYNPNPAVIQREHMFRIVKDFGEQLGLEYRRLRLGQKAGPVDYPRFD
jgi:hypothetical protein